MPAIEDNLSTLDLESGNTRLACNTNQGTQCSHPLPPSFCITARSDTTLATSTQHESLWPMEPRVGSTVQTETTEPTHPSAPGVSGSHPGSPNLNAEIRFDADEDAESTNVDPSPSTTSHSSRTSGEFRADLHNPGTSSTSSTLSSTQEDSGQGHSWAVAQRPPISESLGIWTCTILAGGTAICLGVLAFLIFLWAGEGPSGGEHAAYVWRRIMLSETWSAQTITICAAVVRTVTASQAVVCTSLVAAILLERRHIPLSKVAQVSVARGINDGPLGLLQDVVKSRTLKMCLFPEVILLITITITGFAIQFTSTMLLSCFETATLVQFPQQLHQNLLLSAEKDHNLSILNSYSQFGTSYAVFGELETSDSPEPNTYGVSDTGPKLRSFVPFQQEQRTKLRAYKGPAFSEKTEVMCMRPSIEATLSSLDMPDEAGGGASPIISGTFSYEDTFQQANLGDWEMCSTFYRNGGSVEACLPQNFTCTFPINVTSQVDPLPMIALCHLGMDIVATSFNSGSILMPAWNDSVPLWTASSAPWVYLTFATNLSYQGWVEYGPKDENATMELGPAVARDGEWASYELTPSMVLNITMCFAGLDTYLYNVSMSTSTDPVEPAVNWMSSDAESGAKPGQDMMGTTDSPLTAAQRGILSISDFSRPTNLTCDEISHDSYALWIGPSGLNFQIASDGGSWIMCNYCGFNGWAIPPDIAALFSRTIHTTGRAAWAIQTFLTVYTQSWYAQMLPQFDVAADAEATFSTQQSIPRAWAGLTAVLGIVLAYLSCIWAVAVLYVRQARYTRQGNVWHTVAQLTSDLTEPVLRRANQTTDDTLSEQLKGNDPLVRVGIDKGSGKILVLKV